MASPAQDFLRYLEEHHEVRKKLYDALEDDIVEAARKAGFDLDRDDIQAIYGQSHKIHPQTGTWSR